MVAYFYAYNGLLVPTRAVMLQRAFLVMTEIFHRVGLCNHVVKTVIVAFQPCCAIGGQSMEAYGLCMTVKGRTN